jgi:hypothetical protein
VRCELQLLLLGRLIRGLTCFTTGISTLAHLLPHVTLRRFCSGRLRPAQARLNFGSGPARPARPAHPAHPAHPADRTVAEPRTHPTTNCQPLTSDKSRVGRTVLCADSKTQCELIRTDSGPPTLNTHTAITPTWRMDAKPTALLANRYLFCNDSPFSTSPSLFLYRRPWCINFVSAQATQMSLLSS